MARLLSVIIFFIASYLCNGWADTLEGIQEKAGEIKSVRADFIQEKHLKILSKPLISKGTFYYQATQSLRWEYTSPFQSILLMHNGKIKRYIKGSEGFVQDSGAKLQAMQVVLQEIALWLKGQFNDNPNYNAVLEPGPKVVLTPKEKSFAKIIQRIELLLSNQPGVIKTVCVYENDSSYTKFIFKNVRLNKPLKDSLFQEIQ
ncbi:MAG: outer membrane lipoprotein carrier protein LolA [Deltaproteobacteria bacterium]|nr:outer membrane lipoprotein carrier protein LolA [Deltaproteobacteria bacterium]